MLLNCGVGETLESPLDSKEIQPVYPKGNQSWIFIGRIDAEAEAPILWLPNGKNWLIGKDPDAGQDWRQERKGTTEDETIGWQSSSQRGLFLSLEVYRCLLYVLNLRLITPFFFPTSPFWNRNINPMPIPLLYFGSTLHIWFHRFTAEEKFASGWRTP